MKTATMIVGLVACCGIAHAVTTPYTDDFGTGAGQVDVNDVGSGYVVSTPESTTNDVTLVTLTNSLRMAKIGDDYANAFAAVPTDLSAGALTDFTMTSTITMTTNGGVNYTRFGFLFLGDVANETGLTALFYPNQGGLGQLRIRGFVNFGGVGVDTLNRTSGSIADGSVYTMTLKGAFNNVGDLDLNLTVVNADGGGSENVLMGTILAVDLPEGTEFGVAGRVRYGFIGDYDTVTVIPSAIAANDEEYFLAFEASSTNMAAPGVLANDLGADSAVLVSDISSGSLTFNADGSFSCSDLANGSNTFTYAAVSGSLTSAPATVLLFASLAPDIPIVVDDTFELVLYENQIVGNVLNNDTNTSAILEMFALVEDDSTIANGALSFSSNGAFAFTPDVGFSGTNTFTYKAYTVAATSEVATVTLIVERGPFLTKFIDSFDSYDNSASSNIRDIPGALLNWNPEGTGFADINNLTGSDQGMSVGWSSGYRGCYSTTNLFNGIPSGTTEYWLYWEMYATSVNVDGNFGLTEIVTPSTKAITEFVAGVRMFDVTGSNFNMYAYSSGGDVLLAEAIEVGTYHGIWLNINMAMSTYDVYMGDAGDATTLGTQVGADIPFSAAELNTLLAVAQNSIRLNDVMNVDPESFFTSFPANLYGVSPAAFDTLQLSIGLDVKARPSTYWPVSADDLVFGDMVPVAHSDAPDGTFAVTNLSLASGDETNKVIYVKAADAVEFFQIENNQ